MYNTVGSRRSLAKMFNNRELQFFFRSNNVDDRAVRQAISPNYIHSLDAAHMFLTIKKLLEMGFTNLSMIHDSYGCHAPLVASMRQVIREEFFKMHSNNLLKNLQLELQEQLGIQLPDPPDRGDLDIGLVLTSDYFFA